MPLPPTGVRFCPPREARRRGTFSPIWWSICRNKWPCGAHALHASGATFSIFTSPVDGALRPENTQAPAPDLATTRPHTQLARPQGCWQLHLNTLGERGRGAGGGQLPETKNIFAAISTATAIFEARKGYQNSMVRGARVGALGGGAAFQPALGSLSASHSAPFLLSFTFARGKSSSFCPWRR